ncbi:MAG: hypothetical protein U0931_16700 [Vulcanimicrobiota bacterium]
MNTRQKLHKLIDHLSKNKLQAASSYLHFLSQEEEKLSAGDLAAIRKGRQEVERGETVSQSEILASLGLDPNSP